MQAAERWTQHTKRLLPLVVGNHVRIQNQTGAHPTRWDKTGVVIEVRQFDQYAVRVDGSGRMTIRNRKFLRKYTPVQIQPPQYDIRDDLQRSTYRPHPPITRPKRQPAAPNVAVEPPPSHVPDE